MRSKDTDALIIKDIYNDPAFFLCPLPSKLIYIKILHLSMTKSQDSIKNRYNKSIGAKHQRRHQNIFIYLIKSYTHILNIRCGLYVNTITYDLVVLKPKGIDCLAKMQRQFIGSNQSFMRLVP
jgi:hypothetical protein